MSLRVTYGMYVRVYAYVWNVWHSRSLTVFGNILGCTLRIGDLGDVHVFAIIEMTPCKICTTDNKIYLFSAKPHLN